VLSTGHAHERVPPHDSGTAIKLHVTDIQPDKTSLNTRPNASGRPFKDTFVSIRRVSPTTPRVTVFHFSVVLPEQYCPYLLADLSIPAITISYPYICDSSRFVCFFVVLRSDTLVRCPVPIYQTR
jgi:hypothetical protein